MPVRYAITIGRDPAMPVRDVNGGADDHVLVFVTEARRIQDQLLCNCPCRQEQRKEPHGRHENARNHAPWDCELADEYSRYAA